MTEQQHRRVWASQVAQWVKSPPAAQETPETWVQSLGWEDPPEEGMAAHSSILAWRILWTEEPGGLQSIGSQSQTRLMQLRQASTDRLLQTDVGWYRLGSWAAVTGFCSSFLQLQSEWGPLRKLFWLVVTSFHYYITLFVLANPDSSVLLLSRY